MLLDELYLETQHAIPHAPERPISARIEGPTPGVIAAIDFDDQADGHRYEVTDEATEGHLATKLNTELPAANGQPQALLRRRERRAHVASAKRDERLRSCRFG
jgi:hypothetical protein